MGRQVKRDSETASASFRRMGASARDTRTHIGGLAGMIGLGGLGLGLSSVIKSGTAWEAQQSQLQVALKNTGQNSVETRKKILDMSEALSTHGGFGAAETLQGMTQFVRLGDNASQALGRVGLATNIARSSGRDFTQVLRALMMAEQGRTTGLARLGIAVPKVTTAQMALRNAHLAGRDALLSLTAAGYKFTASQKAQYALHQQITPAMLAQAKAQDALASKNQVFDLLQRRYEGATSAFSGTTAGKISNARNAIDIANKTASQKLLPVVAKLATAGASVIMYLINHKAILIGLGVAIGSVTAILTANRILWEVMRAKGIALTWAHQLLGLETRRAAGSTAGLGSASATSAAEIRGLGGASAAASGKMAGLGVGLLGLAKKVAAGYIALQAFNQAKNDIQETARRFNRGIYTRGGVVQGGVQDYTKGRLPLGIPTVAAHTKAGGLVDFLQGLASGFGLFPRLPFARGGIVPRYFAGGGPVGQDTIPAWLTPGEGVVTPRGMSGLGRSGLAAINSGHMTAPPQVIHLHHTTQLDGRVLARGVTEFQLQRAARGPSSLVGGSLATG